MPKTQNNLNWYLSQYIGMWYLVWPPTFKRSLLFSLCTDWKGQSYLKIKKYLVVLSTANHKSAISHILMFGSSHDAKSNLFFFFMNFDVTQRKFSERALAWRMWLYARAGRPVKSVGPYISARFSWESHIILEESSPVIKSGPLKLLLHCTAFFLCFLDFRLGS